MLRLLLLALFGSTFARHPVMAAITNVAVGGSVTAVDDDGDTSSSDLDGGGSLDDVSSSYDDTSSSED